MQDESPIEKIGRLETQLNNNSQLDLVVCPELFISGYGSFEKIHQYSETSDGEYAILECSCSAVMKSSCWPIRRLSSWAND